MVSLKELDDSMVILVSVDIFNFNEEKNPVIFWEWERDEIHFEL